MRHALLASILLATAVPALADGFSYSYLDARYSRTQGDDMNLDGDGGELSGSFGFAGNFFLAGSGSYDKSDDVTITGNSLSGSYDATSASLLIGGHLPITPALEAEASVGAGYMKVKGQGAFSGDNEDDTDLVAALGLRAALAPYLEVTGSYGYSRVFDADSSTFTLGGEYKFTPNISAVAAAGFGDNADGYQLGARYNF